MKKKIAHAEAADSQTLADVVSSLCGLIESRDFQVSRHIERISSLCAILAAHLAEGACKDQIDEKFLCALPLASTLHDIGKAQIPSYILMKPTALSPDEREILSSHTTYGASLLSQLLWKHPDSYFIRMAEEIARSHHERWDGSGYPEGLSGSQIPLCARIVAVANIYDVLRSAQVYKPAMTHEEALFVISTDFNGRYDPEIITAMNEVAGKFAETYESFES